MYFFVDCAVCLCMFTAGLSLVSNNSPFPHLPPSLPLSLSPLSLLLPPSLLLSPQKSSPGGEAAGGDGSGGCCWENIIGQELFKLNLTHMMADLATMGVDMCRWILPRIPKINKLEKWVCVIPYRD